MDLTFQVPMQYCFLQYWTFLPSPVTSTTGGYFCFVSVSSFFWELFLHSSQVAYWGPTNLGSSSFSVLSFAFSYCSWGSQGKDTEVVCHSLLQCIMFCQNSPPWPIHLGGPYPTFGMAHSFIDLERLWSMWSHWLVFCDCGFQFVCPLMEKGKSLRKLPDGGDWLRGKLGPVLVGRAMLSNL